VRQEADRRQQNTNKIQQAGDIFWVPFSVDHTRAHVFVLAANLNKSRQETPRQQDSTHQAGDTIGVPLSVYTADSRKQDSKKRQSRDSRQQTADSRVCSGGPVECVLVLSTVGGWVCGTEKARSAAAGGFRGHLDSRCVCGRGGGGGGGFIFK
jgi:hypothetical protein